MRVVACGNSEGAHVRVYHRSLVASRSVIVEMTHDYAGASSNVG